MHCMIRTTSGEESTEPQANAYGDVNKGRDDLSRIGPRRTINNRNVRRNRVGDPDNYLELLTHLYQDHFVSPATMGAPALDVGLHVKYIQNLDKVRPRTPQTPTTQLTPDPRRKI